MNRLIERARISMVMAVVLAVGSFTASRLRGVFGSSVSVPDCGTADLIIQFEPKHVICEIYGPVGRLAAKALRCWSEPVKDTGERRVTDRFAKGV
jgi:uroporphyrinogen-III synthase